MRSMFPVFSVFMFVALTGNAFAVKATPVAKAPAPASSSTQWFRDADGDGYAAPDVVAVGPVAPKGTKAADQFRGTNDPDDTNFAVYPGATEESTSDGVDQNGSGPETAGSKEETAKSLSSWTLHANIRNGPNLLGYPKVYGQVMDALEADLTWNVLRGQPDLAAGWAWRSVQNEDGSWGGEAYVIHGTSGNGGSGGFDKKARTTADEAKKAAALAQTGVDEVRGALWGTGNGVDQAHPAATSVLGRLGTNERGVTDLNTALYGTGTASRPSEGSLVWKINHAATQKEFDELVSVLYAGTDNSGTPTNPADGTIFDVFATTDAEIARVLVGETGSESDPAPESVLGKMKTLKAELDDHVDHHISGSVGLGVFGGAQTPVTAADGSSLRPGSFVAPALTFTMNGHPFANGFIAGGEVVGSWVPKEKGLRFNAGPVLGYGWERLALGVTGGGWVATTTMVGRESTVVAYGFDGGARISYEVVQGLAVNGGFTVGSGVRSVKDNDVQDTDGVGFTGGQIGIAFVY